MTHSATDGGRSNTHGSALQMRRGLFFYNTRTIELACECRHGARQQLVGGRPSDVSLLFGSLPWQSFFSPHFEPSREQHTLSSRLRRWRRPSEIFWGLFGTYKGSCLSTTRLKMLVSSMQRALLKIRHGGSLARRHPSGQLPLLCH
jgi:hypothetical protein